ncbi:MAG: hypothetical protein J0L61_11170 [Planctomycetes bacterium]|nr:hypothetical protein [Planctomycetota bacterium]
MRQLITGVAGFLAVAVVCGADTTVSPVRKWAWGENIGWLNWRDANGGLQGVRHSRSFLSGFIWGENVGWINVGNGAPSGGTYANINNTNFGVNVNPDTGECSGFAWGENIGWINFSTVSSLGAQGARYDAFSGRFSGFAWGENVGWINLNDAGQFVCTFAADLNADGIVSTPDLVPFLGAFGDLVTPGDRGDFNGDGLVSTPDLVIFLGQFGRQCS